jgi:hexokinase
MHRLKALVAQLQIGEADLGAACAVQDVKLQLTVPAAKLHQISLHLLDEMMKGLKSTTGSTVRMLPSYVHKRGTDVTGEFAALDLGGTNFRVLKLKLDHGKVVHQEQKQFSIPLEHMQGTGEGLFSFIATSVGSVMAPDSQAPLGFTFSFPVLQLRIDAGKLIAWTKGFTATGVEGQDVIVLLKRAFQAKGLRLKVVALCNDTVGTLITEYFKDNTAAMGVILGTGANACYWEKVRNIPKYLAEVGSKTASTFGPEEEMVINMECGNFDSHPHPSCLPVTAFDKAVDLNSPNPGAQLYEKMISGMYLGELCRLAIVHLHQQGAFPAIAGFNQPEGFSTIRMSRCLADSTPNLQGIAALLKQDYSIDTNLEHRQILRDICQLVAQRSARLSAAGILTVVLKMGVESNCTVSIDGSVFEKVPGYKNWMEAALNELAEGQSHNIRLVLTKEGSGVGAGLIAALANSDK